MAIAIGTKVVMYAPRKDYHNKVGQVCEIRHGAYKGAPKTYTIEYDYNADTGASQAIQLDKKNIKKYKENGIDILV